MSWLDYIARSEYWPNFYASNKPIEVERDSVHPLWADILELRQQVREGVKYANIRLQSEHTYFMLLPIELRKRMMGYEQES